MPQTASFQGLGWKVKLQEKWSTSFITIGKELVRGNLLKKGDYLYYYLVDIEGRKAIIVFLDKKPISTVKNMTLK